MATNPKKKKILNLPEQDELLRLRKKVEKLREEWEILTRPQPSLRKNSNKLLIY